MWKENKNQQREANHQPKGLKGVEAEMKIITKRARESIVVKGKRVQEKIIVIVRISTESIGAVIITIITRAAKSSMLTPPKPVRSRKIITKRGPLIHLNLHHLLRIVLDLLLIRGLLLNYRVNITIIIGRKRKNQNIVGKNITIIIGRTHLNLKEIILSRNL